MNTPTFKEQFDKITEAYFNDELYPYEDCACFVGNLLNGNEKWGKARSFDWVRGHAIVRKNTNFINAYLGKMCIKKESAGLYSLDDIIKLERRFMNNIIEDGNGDYTEDSLFNAIDATLDLLRTIHIQKGEVIESYEIKQRELKNIKLF